MRFDEASVASSMRRRTMSSGSQPAVLDEAEPRAAEARWPMAGAVIAAMILVFLSPDAVRPGPNWLVPLLACGLLVALVVGDPGRIDRRSNALRVLSIVLVSLLVINALWTTGELIADLISGGPETNSASDLLAAGTIVWVSNNIAFALLYWELDSGGAPARAHRTRARPDLAFPQQLNPQLGWTDWSPRFIDYLYLGFTNATAFSPTDVMPLVPWAKIAMAVQAVVSLAILGLVVARAVNVFS
jgi:uncharacterized membrane protein